MKLSQLEYFCAAAEEEHISATAEKLNMTQPALTAAIQRLEEETGTSLFLKKGRNVQLSPEGKILYRHAKEILKEWNAFSQEITDYKESTFNTVRIICAPYIITPQLMSQILEKNPNISIRVYSPLDRNAFRAFEDKKIDLIVNHPPFTGPGTECIHLEDDEMVIISSADTRIPEASGNKVALKDLKSYKFAAYSEIAPLRPEFEKMCMERGFQPKIVFEANTVKEMLPRILSSEAIALIPLRILGDVFEQRIKVYHLTDIDQMPSLGMSWRSDVPNRKNLNLVKGCFINYYKRGSV